ncbi:hypothetical protein ACF3OH_12710 [Chryseomicrobium aureum]|uniref:hypothetical protein n=1 Tax=Chryseomicrobium aureum TaxID=1441723 RepID=UPI00370D61B2
MGEKVRLAILIILTLFMTSQIFTRELVSLKVSAGFVTLYALFACIVNFLALQENKSKTKNK